MSRLTLRGGYAVAAGTFGCVFLPALACERGQRATNAVSKLMYADDALNEYKESNIVRNFVVVMPPHLKDAFIAATALPCLPAPFTDEDLVDADAVCTNFTAAERADLRSVRTNLRVLNQRDGGRSLASLHFPRTPEFHGVHHGIIELLPAVREMNLRGVIHGDIKENNLVYSSRDRKVRVIDWGFVQYLSTFYRVGDHQQFMYNAMPSTAVYKVDIQFGTWPAVMTDAEVVAYARQILSLVLGTATGPGHGSLISRIFGQCNAAREARGVTPIRYAPTGPPLNNLSQEASDIFVAHVVAVLKSMVVVTPDQRVMRFKQMVDAIYRANQDIYGVLTSYHCGGGSEQEINVLATVAPYLMDAKYAVVPYDLDQIAVQFAALNSPGIVVPVDDFTQTVPLFSYDAAIAAIDPTQSRGFPASTDPVASDMNELFQSGHRLLAVAKRGIKRKRTD
jgi:hypothetical protein